VLRSGGSLELAAPATAIAGGGELLVAASGQVLVFDVDGRRRTAVPVSVGVSAVARVGAWLALGNEDGNLELLPFPGAGPRPSLSRFEDVPSSPVVRLLEGPGSTLFAGYANGTAGLWSTRDGSVQETLRLHGPIRHVTRAPDRLYLATELGDHAAIDLRDYLEDYCALLRRIWAEVPVIWEDGQVRLRPPPKHHRCAP